MLRTRPKWPNAAEFCGREVQTTRLGRKRAWWVQGAAFEKFEQTIEPEIKAILKNVDLKDAEIYFRIYMIGKNEEASRPTIMICCADTSVGRSAKESLRNSSIIRNNPEFSLGSIDFPLEQLVPVRRLALESKASSLDQVLGASSDSTADIQIFSTSESATIGRRLFVTYPWSMDIYRHSTGGVVVTSHGRFYQLTVGHIVDFVDGAHQSSSMDPDACSFDGQSDSDAGDEVSIFEQDMRRASMSLFDLSDSGSSDAGTERTASNTVNCRSPACTDYMTTNSDATGCFNHGPSEGPEAPACIRVGGVAAHSKDGDKPSLDYALIAIQPPKENDPINEVTLNSREDTRVLSVRHIADVGGEERRIISITGSGGVMKGTLIPGTTFLGRTNQQDPQKLYVVQLDGVVAEGDSGAAVLDEASGNLYGHVVSGCPGTRVAYIVAAAEVFAALQSQLDGQVSIPSRRQTQKLPVRPTIPSGHPESSTGYQVQDERSEEGPDEHQDMTPRSPPVQYGPYQSGGSIDSADFMSTDSSSIIENCDQLPKYKRLGGCQEPSSSFIACGGQSGGRSTRVATSFEDRPAAEIITTRDSALDIQSMNPYLTKAKPSASTDRRGGNEIGSFKARKKSRKRGYRHLRRVKAINGLKIYVSTGENLTKRHGDTRCVSSKEPSPFPAHVEWGENTRFLEALDLEGYGEEDSLITSFMTGVGPESRFMPQAHQNLTCIHPPNLFCRSVQTVA
ncbi:hypothetical protein NW762_008023 [Fusarium torreyae]|uniref:Serine protease n=1 Tax=Fusarium torreyae TaxID=1237075 RepID=A0A9W8RWV3_9HYPO|nr:hypothetical protein NW762_008023 [Fusarium torreyae]